VHYGTYFLCMGSDGELPSTHGTIPCAINSPAKIPSDLAMESFSLSFHNKDGPVSCFTRLGFNGATLD
jgi:hypothetical protein